MHFSQKALLIDRSEFEFGDKKLTFTYEGETKKVHFEIPYTAISPQKTLKSFSVLAVRRIGRAIVFGALVAYGIAFVLNDSLYRASFDRTLFFAALAVGVACRLLGAKFMKFDATVIDAGPQNKIIIIHDGQHKVIADEIIKRRKMEMRRIFGQVDTLNHPQMELQKFIWLKGEGIISDEEYGHARQKIAVDNPQFAATHF